MSKLQIMDHSGHTTMEFDAKTEAGADHPAVKEAMEKFNELIGRKYTAGKRVPGGDGKFELVRKFDPLAEEIIMMPPLQGG